MALDRYSKAETSSFVKDKRIELGVSQRALACLLGLNENGERTVRGWEAGEHLISKKTLEKIEKLELDAPLAGSNRKADSEYDFRFIDLFAGIGGIRLAFQQASGKCVFSSEWDKFAQKTYLRNFGEMPYGDISEIPADEIPDHDVLLGGFPCQAFSQAGLKKGFHDTRGTMFFEIQRILSIKKPKAFMLENVKQLKGHDGGQTLATILDILRGESTAEIPDAVSKHSELHLTTLEKLNYWVDYRILNARDYGLPQNRERIFLVGFDKECFPKNTDFEKIFHWPKPLKKDVVLGDILEDNTSVDPKYTISEKLWAGHKRRKKEHAEKGNGFGYCLFDKNSEYTSTISARYYKDGSEILINQSDQKMRPRKLTPRESARLQGFPEVFDVSAVSDVQIYKQMGNSVAVPVVSSVAKCIRKTLSHSLKRKRKTLDPQKRLKFHVDG